VYTLQGAHGDADYLLVGKGGNEPAVLRAAFERNTYGLLAKYEDDFFLFKRDLEAEGTAAARTQLGIGVGGKKKAPGNRK
jgi:hypothetical protein